MELNLTVKGNNSPVLTSIKYTKKLDFIDFDQPEKIEFDSSQIIDDDQEHYDFIMELSKETNKKVALRLAEEKNITSYFYNY